MKERTRVVVFVKGGIVTGVYSSDENVDVKVIDCDIDPETDREEYELMEASTRGANFLLDLGYFHSVY